MNPLTSQKNHTRTLNSLIIILVFFSSFGLCSCQATAPIENESALDSPFTKYGFTVSGFTPAQEAIILDTLDAYARALGGPRVLREIIRGFNNNALTPITYDPSILGANSEIRLSPTVFSMALADAADYPCYAAASEEIHAQIVIGHEIAHILHFIALARSGTDWVKVYEQRVSRDWPGMNNPKASTEESVTELSLKVLGTGYFYNRSAIEPESDPQIASEIDAWAEDFLAALKEL